MSEEGKDIEVKILGEPQTPVARKERNYFSSEAVAERLNARTFHAHLYTDGPHETFDAEAVAQFIRETLGKNFPVDVRGDFVSYWLPKVSAEKKAKFIQGMGESKKWALAPSRFRGRAEPLTTEEKKRLEQEMLEHSKEGFIGKRLATQKIEREGKRLPIYDNDYYALEGLISAYQLLIDQSERNLPAREGDVHLHLIVTGRGVASTEIKDTIHCRIGQFSSTGLSIISTTGFLDGPAGPGEYEGCKSSYLQRGDDLGFHSIIGDKRFEKYQEILRRVGFQRPLLALRETFQDKMLLPDDPRMNEVAKGVCLQAIFAGAGEAPFCSSTTSFTPDLSKTCRFRDAHLQEELLNCQVHPKGTPQFCNLHSKALDLLKK